MNQKQEKNRNILYSNIKWKLPSITGPGQGLPTSWDACSSWVRRKMTDASPSSFLIQAERGFSISGFFVCFTNSKARRHVIRKTRKLEEIKLLSSKGCSNSIYMIFNISNLSQAKPLFPHCVAGWRGGANGYIWMVLISIQYLRLWRNQWHNFLIPVKWPMSFCHTY